MTETETVTRKDWMLFWLVIAFVVFLVIAVFITVTDTRGLKYPNYREGMQPLMTLLRTWL